MEKKGQKKKSILSSPNDREGEEGERWKTEKEKKKKNLIFVPDNREEDKGEWWKTKEKEKFHPCS